MIRGRWRGEPVSLPDASGMSGQGQLLYRRGWISRADRGSSSADPADCGRPAPGKDWDKGFVGSGRGRLRGFVVWGCWDCRGRGEKWMEASDVRAGAAGGAASRARGDRRMVSEARPAEGDCMLSSNWAPLLLVRSSSFCSHSSVISLSCHSCWPHRLKGGGGGGARP